MEANELRIDNYIHRNGEICRVVWQDLEWISKRPKEFNSCHKPIPLTEEWLVKMGFKTRFFNEDKSKPVFLNTEKNRQIDIHPHKDHNFYFLVNQIQMSVPLLFVHQIQNLFHSLTGEELTIKP